VQKKGDRGGLRDHLKEKGEGKITGTFKGLTNREKKNGRATNAIQNVSMGRITRRIKIYLEEETGGPKTDVSLLLSPGSKGDF